MYWAILAICAAKTADSNELELGIRVARAVIVATASGTEAGAVTVKMSPVETVEEALSLLIW
jgi:hypothetical protein